MDEKILLASKHKTSVPASSIDKSATEAGLQQWKGHTKDGFAWEVNRGDAKSVLGRLDSASVNCVVTSPPYYWQRDYKVDGQMGQEPSIAEYVQTLVATMEELKRVLRHDGLLFLNLGDTYYSAKGQPKGRDKKNSARRFGLRAVDASGLGVPRKTAIGVPWRVGLEMIRSGWVLRSPIVWTRSSPQPEPTAHDRPWRSYETVFMFSKSPRYFFVRKNLGGEEDIWNISSRRKPNGGIHSAAFPEELVQRCLDIGCPMGGVVLDPFVGSGTTMRVALNSGRHAVGIDLSENYCEYTVHELRRL